MKKYLMLFLSLSKVSTKRYLENRVNALAGIISSLVYFILIVFFISVIFSQTNNIKGWTKYETFLLLGFYKVLSSLFSLLCLRGINFLPEYVRKGDLDLLLTKPLNSQFYLSFRFIRAWEILSFVASLVLVIFSLKNLGFQFSALSIAILFVNLVLGLIILYSFYFSISSLSIWMGRFSAFSHISEIISAPLSYPLDILGRNISLVLTFIIPLGLIITVPIKIFLDKLPLYFSFSVLLFALVLFFFSVWFWNFSLKHYTSASS